MTVMVKANESGGINVLIFPLIATIVLLIGAAGFGMLLPKFPMPTIRRSRPKISKKMRLLRKS
jgi:hypothetical protein